MYVDILFMFFLLKIENYKLKIKNFTLLIFNSKLKILRFTMLLNIIWCRVYLLKNLNVYLSFTIFIKNFPKRAFS